MPLVKQSPCGYIELGTCRWFSSRSFKNVTQVSCLLNDCFHCIETFLLTFASQSMAENRLCSSLSFMNCVSGITHLLPKQYAQSMLLRGNLIPYGHACTFQFPVGMVFIFPLSRTNFTTWLHTAL